MKKMLSFNLLLFTILVLGFSNSLFGQYGGTGTFVKITSLTDLTDGYYVITNSTSEFAMNNTNGGNYFGKTDITPILDEISDPDASIVWKIETNGSYKTIYNEAISSYVACTTNGNNAQATNPGTLTDAEKWTVTYENDLFKMTSVNFSTRDLQYNASSPRFACYTSNQQRLTLYRMGESSNPCGLFEDFEAAAWAAANYTQRNVTDLAGNPWIVSGIGNMDGNDRFNDARSIRLRGNSGDACRVEMNFDKPDGIGTASFSYASYATHSNGQISLYYSIDHGSTWILAGSVIAPAWDGTMLTTSYTLNIAGEIRIKIVRDGTLASSTSVNIDDICLTNYGSSSNNVAAPSFMPASGTYVTAQDIVISSTTPDAAIYYTTNGTDPTTASTLYTAPITLDVNGTYTIKAIATKAGMNNSDIVTATYTINIPTPLDCDFLEDFENLVSGSGAYAGADVTFGSGEWRVVGYTTMDGNDRYNGTRSVRLRGNTNDTCHVTMKFNKPNGIGKLTFRYGSYSSHSNGQISSYYSTDNGANWILIGSVVAPGWAAGGSELQEVEYVLNIPGDVRIKIARDGTVTGSSSVNIDDICVTDFGAPTSVATPTFTPAGGSYFTPQNVTIACATEGATIYYTTNGTDPTTSSAVYTNPIPLSATTTIKALATKAAMPNSNIATAIYTFPIEVPTIAAFKAANTATSTTIYKITGDVTFVFRAARYIYIKDATAGLLIYDNATSLITNTYDNGDVISGGVIGSCTIYNGLYELIPAANLAAGTPGTPVEPIVLTMAALNADFNTYESQLVKIEKTTFDAGTFGTGAAANINFYQNSTQMICRNNYGNITGYETDPTKYFDVTGFAIPYNTDKQIAPRDLDDISEASTLSVSLTAEPTMGGTLTGGGNYFEGDEVTINATPNAAYNFVNWTEEGTQVTENTSYTFTITADRAFVANFQIKTYTITATAGANGDIAPTGTTTVNHGTNQTYTITPNPGYEIDRVLVDGVNNATAVTSGTYTFTNVTANHTISVTFKLKQYTLTLNPSTGTVSPTTIAVTYNTAIGSIPDAVHPNCTFKGWFIDDTQIFASTTWTYTSNQTAIAVFDYPIVATNSNPALGSITPTGTVNYSYGQSASYVSTPIAGAHITTVIVDGITVFTGNEEISAPYTHTFTDIADYHTIQVDFAMNCYAINPDNIIGAGAELTMIPASCVPHGTTASFEITTQCYDITQVLIDGVPQGIISSFTLNATEPLPVIEVQTAIKQYTITASPVTDPMGNVSPSGPVVVNCGDNQVFEFNTYLDYRVKAIFVDDVSIPVPLSLSYTFFNVQEDHTINVEFEPFPQYIIQFGPSEAQGLGGSVFSTNQPNVINYIAVDSATIEFPFSIVPATGYVIDQVYVDNVINPQAALTGSYTFTHLKSNHTIYATFKPTMLTITATAGANGTINPSGTVQVAYGTDQLFQVFPTFGSHITDLIVDGTSLGAINNYTFSNVTENHTIAAYFAKNIYNITTISNGFGEITPENPEVMHNANQTLNFIPIDGYKVGEVLIDGINNPAAVLNGSFTFFNVTQNHTVEVTFIKKVFTITATHSVGGQILPSGVAYIEYGDNSEIYIFDSWEGFHVKYAIIDGVNDLQAIIDGECRFVNVSENHTIHIQFAPNNFTIEATATEGGDISPAGAVPVVNGDNQIFYMVPQQGYDLVRVIVDGINAPEAVATGTYTFYDVAADHSIEAQFEKKWYDVVYQVVPGALVIPEDESSSPVEHGGSYKFTVELEEAYTQSKILVRVNGIALLPTSGIYTITNIFMDQMITIEGVVLNKYEVMAQAFIGGTITPAGIFMVNHGEEKTFVMTPDAGFIVSDVVVNGVSIGNVDTYTFFDIRENSTIKAYFAVSQGVDANDEAALTVFSNHNVVTILNENMISIKQVEIIDMYGRLVWSGQALTDRTEITLNVATGIYGVRVITVDNQITTKVTITR